MKRPKFLTILLIVMVLSDIFSLYSYTVGKSFITSVLSNFPSWAFTALTILGMFQLAGVVLTWKWQKMGIYFIVASGVGAFFVNALTLGIGSSILGIIGLVVLYFAIKPVWKNFK